jgi:hypothetical protein
MFRILNVIQYSTSQIQFKAFNKTKLVNPFFTKKAFDESAIRDSLALLSRSGEAFSGAGDCSEMIITWIFWYSMSSVAGVPSAAKALLFPAPLHCCFCLSVMYLVCLLLLVSLLLYC